jgi:hypothetical protein
MSTSPGADFPRIERRKRRLVAVGRRQLLALFLAAMAVPGAAMSAWWNIRAGPRRVVIVNGWVLLEDDVREVASRVA